LLDFEHAQIPLGLVVVEGNREVVKEGEHLVLLQEEPLRGVVRAGCALGIV
jgi:hypothetical protein